MILSQAWTKLLPLFPAGVRYDHGRELLNGIWKWNKKRITWQNTGKCPHCGTFQVWNIVHDDSYILGVGYFRCKVSCKIPSCGNQVSLIIQSGRVTVEEV